MNITIKLENEKFYYDYSIGKSKEHGEMELSPERLALFVNITTACSNAWMKKTDEEMNNIQCFAYLEKHPELIEKYMEQNKKQ